MYKSFSNYPTWLAYAWIISNDHMFMDARDLCRSSLNNDIAALKLRQFINDRLIGFKLFPEDKFEGFFKDLFKWIVQEIEWTEISGRLRQQEGFDGKVTR